VSQARAAEQKTLRLQSHVQSRLRRQARDRYGVIHPSGDWAARSTRARQILPVRIGYHKPRWCSRLLRQWLNPPWRQDTACRHIGAADSRRQVGRLTLFPSRLPSRAGSFRISLAGTNLLAANRDRARDHCYQQSASGGATCSHFSWTKPSILFEELRSQTLHDMAGGAMDGAKIA